ncbi:hypothetical protein OJ997_32180, partial [Solirubrobacter phytolaccae]
MLTQMSSATWPLVGRADELARLSELRATSRGVVLSGRAGVGKSRLARETLALARSGGAVTEWVQGTRSAAAVPLGAFAALMPVDAGAHDALDLVRAGEAELRRRADGREIVIGVDDAQLLDPLSAALALHLVTTGTAFVVATVRAGQAVPDAIQALWKDSGAERVEVVALDADGTAALAEAALGGPLGLLARRWLYDVSRGNALFVRELLLGAVEDGAIAQRDGVWRLMRRPVVRRSLTELVEARLASLSGEERAVVELLSLGEPLRIEEALDLGGDALLDVEARGLIAAQAPADGGEVRLRHPLFGEVVRDGLPLLRARMLRLRLAERLARRDPLTREDALRIARWRLDAGADVELGLLLRAATAAVRGGDKTEA